MFLNHFHGIHKIKLFLIAKVTHAHWNIFFLVEKISKYLLLHSQDNYCWQSGVHLAGLFPTLTQSMCLSVAFVLFFFLTIINIINFCNLFTLEYTGKPFHIKLSASTSFFHKYAELSTMWTQHHLFNPGLSTASLVMMMSSTALSTVVAIATCGCWAVKIWLMWLKDGISNFP